MAFLGSGVRRGQRGDTAMVGSDGRFSVVGRWQRAQRERGEKRVRPQHVAPLRTVGLDMKLISFAAIPRALTTLVF